MPILVQFAPAWLIRWVHRRAFVGGGRYFGLASLRAPQLRYKRPLYALPLAVKTSLKRSMLASRCFSRGYNMPVPFAKEFFL